jgi:hypothetical protein
VCLVREFCCNLLHTCYDTVRSSHVEGRKYGWKLIVIAIGGNSLIEDPNHVTVSAQYEAARKTASHIVRLVEQGNRVVIAPERPAGGYILLRAEYSRSFLHIVPLDSCVADTQGAIGYNLQMALDNEFHKVGMQPPVATVVTQWKSLMRTHHSEPPRSLSEAFCPNRMPTITSSMTDGR